MATQPNKIPLNDGEKKDLQAAFDTYKATQVRAANNAKNQMVKEAYEMSARQIQALEVKIFSCIE